MDDNITISLLQPCGAFSNAESASVATDAAAWTTSRRWDKGAFSQCHECFPPPNRVTMVRRQRRQAKTMKVRIHG